MLHTILEVVSRAFGAHLSSSCLTEPLVSGIIRHMVIWRYPYGAAHAHKNTHIPLYIYHFKHALYRFSLLPREVRTGNMKALRPTESHLRVLR